MATTSELKAFQSDTDLPEDMAPYPETGEGLDPSGNLAELPPPASVSGTYDAEKHLKSVAYWRRVKHEKEQHAKAYLEAETKRVQEWLRGELDHVSVKLAWHENGLVKYMTDSGQKALKLIAGTVRFKKGRDSIEILDEKAFMAWAKAEPGRWEQFVREKKEYSPIKDEIKKIITGTGEVPDGTELVTGESKGEWVIDV